MSKHTNKVHGKLNFLIIGVVVVFGAVAYLLVQTGTIDPSMGTSSGIKGVKKAVKYDNRNKVVVELDGEEIQEILNNQDFLKMVSTPEFSKLVGDPDFIKMLDDDGIGIMSDIYNSNLEEGYIDIKDKRRGDRIEKANVREDGSGSGSGISSDRKYTGSSGNPANSDSGIGGSGGVAILPIGIINKIADFQKFTKSSTFTKFQKDAVFQKFLKSGADFSKFQKDDAFQKFQKDAEFQKFMKSDQFQKFMKDATLQKFMKSTDLNKFAKGADLERFAKSQLMLNLLIMLISISL